MTMTCCLAACKDTIVNDVAPLPTNPYDTLDYDPNVVPAIPVDSNTFLGIHQYILATRCAQPACHDGSFEPDYRTVMSAYNSLVYAKALKNTADSAFTYRVVPFDTTLSWLHERITTDDPVLGRMPLYDTLPQRQIDMIANWILSGAKDIYGDVPGYPDPQPSFYGIAAYLTSGNVRVDTARGGYFLNPFLAPANAEMKIWFGIYDKLDFSTNPFTVEDFLNTMTMVNNGQHKVKFSTDPLNFDNAPFVNLTTVGSPLTSTSLYGTPTEYYLNATVNTALYEPGDVVYMRVYAKDDDHADHTQIPSATSPFYFKTYFAFVVQ